MKGLERGRIIAGLLAATVLAGVAAVSYRVGAGHGPVVVTGEGETVRVIGGGWHGGPPFGLFFFLLLAGLLFLAFSGRRHYGCGPGWGPPGGPGRESHDAGSDTAPPGTTQDR